MTGSYYISASVCQFVVNAGFSRLNIHCVLKGILYAEEQNIGNDLKFVKPGPHIPPLKSRRESSISIKLHSSRKTRLAYGKNSSFSDRSSFSNPSRKML